VGDSIEREILREIGAEVVTADPGNLRELARDADALLVCWAPVPAELISELRRCRMISLYTAGADNVDLRAAARAGIVVTNNPDYCVREVAMHALTMILACNRKLAWISQAVRSGTWDPVGLMKPAPALQAQIVGILGHGRIGRELARLLQPLAGRVLAHQRSGGDAGYPEFVSLEELLARADYLSIHVPLNDATRGLLNREALGKMKREAFLINTSRGAVIDEAALIEALEAAHLGGAALDVFTTEPLPADSRLRLLPNVLITPHVAWYSARSEYLLHANAAKNILRFFQGVPVPQLTTPQCL